GLAFHRFPVARSVLEGGEPGGRAPLGAQLPSPRSGQGSRCSDQPTEEEGAETAASSLPVHGRILLMLLCPLGDALLDVIVRAEEPLAEGDDVTVSARLGAGGQAANVAAWAVELGARGRVISKRADDAAASLVAAELADRGIEL